MTTKRGDNYSFCEFCGIDGHWPEYCTLLRGLYCSKCACYGHSFRICPEKYDYKLQVINLDIYIKIYLNSKGVPCNGIAARGAKLRQMLTEYAASIGISRIDWIKNPIVLRPGGLKE